MSGKTKLRIVMIISLFDESSSASGHIDYVEAEKLDFHIEVSYRHVCIFFQEIIETS
jgi:hypothetical protein